MVARTALGLRIAEWRRRRRSAEELWLSYAALHEDASRERRQKIAALGAEFEQADR
jgi:hypothetical protein